MKIRWVFLMFVLIASHLFASDLPYDEKADAKVDLHRALALAQTTKKKVMLVFGANWCPDCRRLDKTIYDANSALNGNEFVTVKVDVGNFNKNLDLAKSFGNPIKKGIPGAVILTADEKVLYAGPLSRLVTPHRRIAKIILIASVVLGLGLTGIAGLVFLKKNKLANRQRDAAGTIPPHGNR